MPRNAGILGSARPRISGQIRPPSAEGFTPLESAPLAGGSTPPERGVGVQVNSGGCCFWVFPGRKTPPLYFQATKFAFCFSKQKKTLSKIASRVALARDSPDRFEKERSPQIRWLSRPISQGRDRIDSRAHSPA